MTFKQLLDLNEIERDAKGIYHSISNTQTTDQLDLVVVPVSDLKVMDIG